nr:hypothetical protein L204_02555 [Cryptococcus depauperatus CBS 7855]
MPSCRITNNTAHPLNVSLKQVTALHFENGVKPGQTIKLKPGKVWFTLECLVDDETKKTRYSVLKSAATIAVISIAVGAVAATAGAALLPEVVALETVAAAGIAGSAIAKGVTATKTALVANSGTIARLSSVALPKAVDKLSAEIGGLTALQREGSAIVYQRSRASLISLLVLSVISSPTLSSDVRHKSASLLRSLHSSYTKDKAARQKTSSSNPNPSQPSARLVPLTTEEAVELEKAIDSGEIDDRVENIPIRTGEVLRVHGIYMKERRHFEIRVGDEGTLTLYDVHQKKYIA